jgi:hypothetical protein
MVGAADRGRVGLVKASVWFCGGVLKEGADRGGNGTDGED